MKKITKSPVAKSKEFKPSESKSPDTKAAVTTPPTKLSPTTKSKPAKKPRSSGLNAAAEVLAKSKDPMSCGDLTKRIIDLKLWKTGGKTPAATINAAILREIRAKGSASRFRKVGRGLFAAGKASR